jgi:hypothetical protein
MKRLVALAFTCALLLSTATASAQDALDVRESSATSDFPNGIAFRLEAMVDGAVEEVRLVYEVAPDGVRATAEAECVGGAALSCAYTLPATPRTRLIPSAELTYFWRVTLDGATQETDPQAVTYLDDRFDWQTITEGNVTLWWYAGGDDGARAVLAASRESLESMSALLQTTVDFPVKVLFYASVDDMAPAIISNDGPGVVTLGEVVYSDTAMVSASTAPADIARHEVAHIVIRQAVEGPFGIPDWLNEGTAVYAQERLLENQRAALDQAIAANRVFSVRSLSSASLGSQGDRVSLFYAQSWSVVDFLVSEFGEEKFAELFRAFRDGARTAEALQTVYGFDQDGLENAWRAHVGLPPRSEPTRDPALDEPAEAAPTPAAQRDGGGGAPVGLIAAIAVLTALLAGGLAGAGLVLARRTR